MLPFKGVQLEPTPFKVQRSNNLDVISNGTFVMTFMKIVAKHLEAGNISCPGNKPFLFPVTS